MFLINLQGKETIYEQIRNQIEDFIRKGILKPNDKLPSVRTVASELGINPNTVQKAYRTLEEDGLIYTLDKKGAYVSSGAIQRPSVSDIEKIVKSIKDSGFSCDELHDVINRIYKEEK